MSEGEKDSDLPDLAGLTLDDLEALPDSAFATALRRILAELDAADEPVAGFQSAIPA
jgi:FXSXX-COOH protein